MLSAEEILLLTSHLGYPQRSILTPAQFRTFAEWSANVDLPLRAAHCALATGLDPIVQQKAMHLLKDAELLQQYLYRAANFGCLPLTLSDTAYPRLLRANMGVGSTACLWARGNTNLLEMPCISLVGSRDISPKNLEFSRHVGMQAAKQGYVLVSGNARGADRAGQSACLSAGGSVICVVADGLCSVCPTDRMLYLSESDFDAEFSSRRALHRNHVIHALSRITFVAQCSLKKGGTWSGSESNLRHGFSALYCFRDGSDASSALEQLGAHMIDIAALADFRSLQPGKNLFDMAESRGYSE